MTEKHEKESPDLVKSVKPQYIAMNVFLGLSVVSDIMGHVNIAVALAGIGGLAMMWMFMVMIGATFLPLPEFSMNEGSHSHPADADERPTIH